MALDFSSTPEEYATPEEVRASRAMAQALITGKSGQQVPYHWTQAVSNVLHSLEGRSREAKANKNDRASLKGSAQDPTGSFEGADQSAPEGYGTPEAQKKTLWNWGPNPLEG